MILAEVCGSYHLRVVLCFFQINPDIIRPIQRRCEPKERHGAKPGTLDERPNQEAIEVVILSSALAFGMTEFDEKYCFGRVAGNLNNIVLLKTTEGVVQVRGEPSWREDKFTAEELYGSVMSKIDRASQHTSERKETCVKRSL